MVLDDFVGDVAEPGVFHRELGERAVARGFHDRPRRRGRDFVELRLGIALKNGLRGARARDQRGHAACAGVASIANWD